ncbi:MAG TPA: rRNA maturation RNase YbeY [Oligoflexia bacterium]|nr:rRNA maturation RNase YbeY [Oligoflexia bacterium]HMR25579.1 rRNA maturation RNase YbeY [Oligoflexia bacterium]
MRNQHHVLTSSEHPDWEIFEHQAQFDLSHLLAWQQQQACEVSVAFVAESTIQQLNLDYRQKNKPTDVLSFEQNEIFGKYHCLGDIIICVPVAQAQAQEKSVALPDEIRLLLTHGFLHLLGYDHAEPEEEKIMFALQDELVQKLKQTVIASH